MSEDAILPSHAQGEPCPPGPHHVHGVRNVVTPPESDREILMRLDHNMALLLEAVQSMVGIVEGFSSHPMAGALVKLMKR